MSLIPFGRYLEGEGLSFGLDSERLDDLGERTRNGEGCRELLSDPALTGTGIGPAHLMRIRRAWQRYAALREKVQGLTGEFRNAIEAAGARWAARQDPESADRKRLASSFASAVSATLKHGRLRFHLKKPGDPGAEEFAALAGHSEGCLEIPPHRWFSASRGVSEGMIWIEVIPPEEELRTSPGSETSAERTGDLLRSVAKPVLDAIGESAERQVVAAAAEALVALLSRPRIHGAVAGVAVDRKIIFVCLLARQDDGDQAEFDAADIQGLAGWIARREPAQVGVATLHRGGASAGVIKSLAGHGLAVEPVREAGLMKQAGSLPGSIKMAAARVVAERLRDPLEGYAGLDPDELGLGEYLDRVSGEKLRAALRDAWDVVAWERQTGKASGPVARGISINPMVKGLSDLRPGMEMTGSVANLTHFGAFVELGIGVQGLIHLSELSEKFIKHPSEVVQVGERVRVRVLEVDEGRNRISLSMRDAKDRARGPKRNQQADAIKNLDKLFKK